MADTSTIELLLRDLRGPFRKSNTAAAAKDSRVKITGTFEAEHLLSARRQLSRFERIIEYLKVLYR
ncbi:MAG: hypothetical protein AUH81_16540 [Candidatus Rokubacteria bacterium 13_1_40CM_4_69_5]|nr:MAG: hypothetical protein AUH81_16540 [Candidatus Rokubacteria bacterium 13_1_40CM_4_69_5]